MQNNQPKLLVLWGKHDLSFDLGELERHRRDVPRTEVHVLDARHSALDTRADDIAELVGKFMPGRSNPHNKWHRKASLPSLIKTGCGGKCHSLDCW